MQVHKSSELSPLQEAWETSLNSDLNSHIKKEREKRPKQERESEMVHTWKDLPLTEIQNY